MDLGTHIGYAFHLNVEAFQENAHSWLPFIHFHENDMNLDGKVKMIIQPKKEKEKKRREYNVYPTLLKVNFV